MLSRLARVAAPRAAARWPGACAARRCSSLAAIRNVGIIAHIDAGKTTTTERMLLLAGVTRAAGGVDTGDTVMDFMEQERERGITIQAAATSFSWDDHAVALIDTPGHVDFTIEVERTTRVLDGAVLVVDSVAGAQAQTETVWRQARSHDVPAIAFINKMDREGASFESAIASLEHRLRLVSLPLQLPLLASCEWAHEAGAGAAGGGGAAAAMLGVIDLVHMQLCRYAPSAESHGGRAQRGAALSLERVPLAEPSGGGGAMLGAAAAARLQLVERVAELDPDGEVADLYLDEREVPPELLRDAIRGLTLRSLAVPTLCGASLHGIGVEPLLDAVVSYLPSPSDRQLPLLAAESGGEPTPAAAEVLSLYFPCTFPVLSLYFPCTFPEAGGEPTPAAAPAEPQEAAEAVALAFKVVHDGYSKKPLVWLRVYSGELSHGETLHNARTGASERPTRLLEMHGELSREPRHVGPGSIVAAQGLKGTRTGDTLLLRPKEGFASHRLPELRAPAPVFFCSVETHSSSQQKALDAALAAIVRPQSSLRTHCGEVVRLMTAAACFPDRH